MATATANPEVREGFWSSAKRFARTAFNWTTATAVTVWRKGTVAAKSFGSWAWAGATGLFNWARLSLVRIVSVAAFTVVWLGRGFFRSIGLLAGAAAWLIGAVLSMIGSAVGALGAVAGMAILVIAVAFLFTSHFWNDYVTETFRWMGSNSKTRLPYRTHIKARRQLRQNGVEPFSHTTDAYSDPFPETGQEPADETLMDFNEGALRHYKPGTIFTMDPTGKNDTSQGDLIVFDDDISYIDDRIVLGPAIHQSGIRVPVLFDFSEVFNDYDALDGFFKWAMESAPTRREKSYWMGRLEFMNLYIHDENLTADYVNINKTWALLAQKLQSRQREFNFNYLRAGFYDMAKEAQRARRMVHVEV